MEIRFYERIEILDETIRRYREGVYKERDRELQYPPVRSRRFLEMQRILHGKGFAVSVCGSYSIHRQHDLLRRGVAYLKRQERKR